MKTKKIKATGPQVGAEVQQEFERRSRFWKYAAILGGAVLGLYLMTNRDNKLLFN